MEKNWIRFGHDIPLIHPFIHQIIWSSFHPSNILISSILSSSNLPFQLPIYPSLIVLQFTDSFIFAYFFIFFSLFINLYFVILLSCPFYLNCVEREKMWCFWYIFKKFPLLIQNLKESVIFMNPGWHIFVLSVKSLYLF